MGENIVVVLCIDGALAIILLFCDYHDTGSESCDMEKDVSVPILTHKNITKAIWDKNVHTL